MEKNMKDSSMTTELDDILMSIEGSSEDLCFFLRVMKELNLEIPQYSEDEAKLIKKSQKGDITAHERETLEAMLTSEREVLDNQEDMVRSFLGQCNRDLNKAKLNIH